MANKNSGRRAEAQWIPARSIWQIKVQKDGERRAFTSGTPGRKGKHEAEAKADAWLLNGDTEKKELRFDEAWKVFLEYYEQNGSRPNYLKYESIGRLYISPVIGRRRLSAITPINWQACVDSAVQRGLSRRSCKNVRLAIGSFLNFARRNRWNVEPLYPGDVVVSNQAPVNEKKILQPDDLVTLFSCDTIKRYNEEIFSHYIYAWRFLVLTGLRRGELCGLRLSDIDGSVMHIQRSLNSIGEETRGKNDNAQRTVVLSKHALEVLEQQKKMLRRFDIRSPFVFPDEYGLQTDSNSLYDRWYVYRKQHGINVSLHELRHTFISIVKNDMPLAMLKSVVGHSESMDSIGVYGHNVTGEDIAAARIVDASFDKAFEIGKGEKHE